MEKSDLLLLPAHFKCRDFRNDVDNFFEIRI